MKRGVLAALLVCVGLFFARASFASDNIQRGIALFEQGKVTEAQQFFTSFVQENPTNAAGMFYLGRTLFSEEKYDQAVQLLEQAVLIDGRNSDYHLWLGRAYGHLALQSSVLWQFPLSRRVRRHFEKAVELNPDNLAARADLMEYYLKAPRLLGGGKEKAEEQAQEITARDLEEGLRAWKMIAQESVAKDDEDKLREQSQ